MNAYLRVVVGPFHVLVPRDGVARVESLSETLVPLPPGRRAPRPMLYVDGARLLGVEVAAGARAATALHLFPTDTGLEWQCVVERVERIETHGPGDFQPLPKSLFSLRRFVDGVLYEAADRPLVLRLRLPVAMASRALARRLLSAALCVSCGDVAVEPVAEPAPLKKRGKR